MNASTTTTNFYNSEAAEIYSEDFDFTVIADDPLPTLRKVVRSVLTRVLTIAASAAVTAILTIPAGGNLPFDTSEPVLFTESAEEAPNLVTMTAHMRERAAFASRVFRRTPHPGDDDIEPDYGF